MPLEQDGSGAGHRANHILKDALDAQLNLLHAFFPLQGWLVGRRRNGVFNVLAAQGSWRHKGGLAGVGDLMHGQWAVYPEHPGFHYRTLGQSEQALTSELVSTSPAPECIIRRPMRNSDGYVQAWLVGVANQLITDRTADLDFPVEYIKQALGAMALTMSLHADFEAANRQLVELQRNAFLEPLTGVLNRAGWVNRVEHLEALVARTDDDVAIVMLDLDLLKRVNDMQGHSAGDELLQLTAKTIRSVLRGSDVIGRLGGDEFGVAVKGVTRPLAQALVERLRGALDHVGVEVSLGMALKSEAGSLDDTLALADMRMYEDKRSKPLSDRAMNWHRAALSQEA